MELSRLLTDYELNQAANLFGCLSHMSDYAKKEAIMELIGKKFNQQTIVSGSEWFKLFKYLTNIGAV